MIRPHHVIAAYLGFVGQGLLYYALFVLIPKITCLPVHWVESNVDSNVCRGEGAAWAFGVLGFVATVTAIIIEFAAYYESKARS